MRISNPEYPNPAENLYLCKGQQLILKKNSSDMKYLNPKADLTFKKVFGEHPDLMMSLLNALLPFESLRAPA